MKIQLEAALCVDGLMLEFSSSKAAQPGSRLHKGGGLLAASKGQAANVAA
jgi:hypothetical protein